MSIFLPSRRVNVKIRYGLCSLQIFNAILRTVFSAAAQLPLPWVKHARSSALPSFLKHGTQKAKSSMSLQPHLIFSKAILNLDS